MAAQTLPGGGPLWGLADLSNGSQSCISRISVSHLPGMLSSFLAQPCSCLSLKQLKKKKYSEIVLRNCVTRLPGLTKL